MINLIWSEIRQVSVEEDTLYSALLYIYRTYIGSEDDSIDEISRQYRKLYRRIN